MNAVRNSTYSYINQEDGQSTFVSGVATFTVVRQFNYNRLVLDLEHSSNGLLFLEVFVYLTNHRWDVWNVTCHSDTIIMVKTFLYKKGTAKCFLNLFICDSKVTRFSP